MDFYTIWESAHFRLSQSYDFCFPGYMFVECLSGVRRMNDFGPGESEELAYVLKLGERLLDLLIRPERIYVLKFGESDDRIHFHLIPRTAELLKSYLDDRQESSPYNGALITAWLWANAGRLGHSQADIQNFISSARKVSEELTSMDRFSRL
jgi:diadenosine tetraphosphate (Ap4A) HIT family hydrolase